MLPAHIFKNEKLPAQAVLIWMAVVSYGNGTDEGVSRLHPEFLALSRCKDQDQVEYCVDLLIELGLLVQHSDELFAAPFSLMP